MSTTFGFLTQPGTFSIDVPASVDPVYEQVAAVGLVPQESLTIQCARAERVDFSNFGWHFGYQVNAGSETVDVYECIDPPDVVMPVWRAGDAVMWMQLRGSAGSTRSELLAVFASGIRPETDSFGIPRITVGRGIVKANPVLHATCRDTVLFNVAGSTQMLVIRNDGALGKEGRFVDGDSAWASATTAYGITVERDGAPDDRDELLREAQEIAASIRQVA